MNRAIKTLILIGFAALAVNNAWAQDIVSISEGNFLRGTIQGTDFSTVVLKTDDEKVTLYTAKDIKEFVWNGETYVSKPIVLNKKSTYRFFKLIEQGTVNLYEIGGGTGMAEQPQPKRARIRPSIGIGTGTGGFGGVGLGGGISFGGGRNSNAEPVRRAMPSTFFIEKINSGPMLEIQVEGANSAAKTQAIKNALLQKLTNDEDLAERINATENFDAKMVRAYVAAYNAMRK